MLPALRTEMKKWITSTGARVINVGDDEHLKEMDE